MSDPDSLGADNDSELPAAKYSWAQLMRRSFDIDMNKCPSCGSENFKVVAVIEDQDVVKKILNHVGLEARAPPIAPAKVQSSKVKLAGELEYQDYFD